eukprot:TRINITY_DN516_c0_g1_i1.p1 TRINITY_DN516_c0_g1~~TRINITY_DN516_c0_g1_i1.p1  ORF type:complete len:228 (-),score=30.69 TRINITY_DN516_c0_g1_i1:813-1496(-)
MVTRTWKIGLAGGIACGKSNILRILGRLGVATFDCDSLGHDSYKPHTKGWKQVKDIFGEDILHPTGEINRVALSRKVFGPSMEKNIILLNQAIWPEIETKAKKRLKSYEDTNEPLVVMEGAILIEAGWHKFLDEVWVAEVPPEISVERLQHRGLSLEEAQQRVKVQLTNEERRKHADFIIDTYYDTKEFNEKKIVTRLRDTYTKLKLPVPTKVVEHLRLLESKDSET